jgi:hypothetical protein
MCLKVSKLTRTLDLIVPPADRAKNGGTAKVLGSMWLMSMSKCDFLQIQFLICMFNCHATSDFAVIFECNLNSDSKIKVKFKMEISDFINLF